MLNKIWGSFFIIAFVVGLGRWLFLGEVQVWAEMVSATFDMAKTGFEIALGLTGVMCLWLGIMKLGEEGGAIDILAKAFGPLMKRLFPDIPEGHPATGSIVMNMAANMLGLDNAATPLGLKAMSELQELNPDKETASNDQILFLVINTSAVTLIPLIAWLGAGLTTPLFPETERLVSQMNAGDIWSRYVRYIGAGAVATAGILTVLRGLPTMWGAFAAVARGTQDPMIRDRFLEAWRAHVQVGMRVHEQARGDYDAYDHWVPQFAVYALTPDFN